MWRPDQSVRLTAPEDPERWRRARRQGERLCDSRNLDERASRFSWLRQRCLRRLAVATAADSTGSTKQFCADSSRDKQEYLDQLDMRNPKSLRLAADSLGEMVYRRHSTT